MDHATFRRLAAGAALDDLDASERRVFDRHAQGCTSCAELAVSLDDVLADLALTTPERTPPDILLGATLRALPRVQAVPDPVLTPARIEQRRAPVRMRPTWAALAVAAVLAVVTAGLAARTVQLTDDAAVASDQLRTQAAAMSVILDPAHRTASLSAEPAAPSADAMIVYHPGTDEAFLMADHLPATPDGMVYQLWNADAQGVHALATFRYSGTGPFLAPFGVDLAGSTAAMVTLEPIGGATGEPGPQVVFGEL